MAALPTRYGIQRGECGIGFGNRNQWNKLDGFLNGWVDMEMSWRATLQTDGSFLVEASRPYMPSRARSPVSDTVGTYYASWIIDQNGETIPLSEPWYTRTSKADWQPRV